MRANREKHDMEAVLRRTLQGCFYYLADVLRSPPAERCCLGQAVREEASSSRNAGILPRVVKMLGHCRYRLLQCPAGFSIVASGGREVKAKIKDQVKQTHKKIKF